MFHLGIGNRALGSSALVFEGAAGLPEDDKSDLYRLLCGPTATPECLARMFNREIFPSGFIVPGSAAATALQIVAKSQKWGEPVWSGMQVADLACPAISERVIRDIFGADETSTTAKTALAANPNCPRDIRREIKPNKKFFIEARAAYGDLNDKETAGVLVAAITTGRKQTRGLLTTIMCSRRTLTPFFAEKLDAAVGDENVYDHLAQIGAHRELVAARQDTYSFPDYFRKESTSTGKQLLKLSPELTSENLTRLYDDCDQAVMGTLARGWALARIAAMPNADRALVDRALAEGGDWIRPALLAQESPHAEYSMLNCLASSTDIMILAASSRATERGLVAAYRDSLTANARKSRVAIVSNPNFPWDKIPLSQVSANLCEQSEYAAIYCAAHLSGKCTQHDLDQIPAEHACSALFNPTLSGRKVETIAADFPGIASLAAVHPNGQDVELHGARARGWAGNVAQKIRGEPVHALAGRGATPPGGKGGQIVL